MAVINQARCDSKLTCVCSLRLERREPGGDTTRPPAGTREDDVDSLPTWHQSRPPRLPTPPPALHPLQPKTPPRKHCPPAGRSPTPEVGRRTAETRSNEASSSGCESEQKVSRAKQPDWFQGQTGPSAVWLNFMAFIGDNPLKKCRLSFRCQTLGVNCSL